MPWFVLCLLLWFVSSRTMAPFVTFRFVETRTGATRTMARRHEPVRHEPGRCGDYQIFTLFSVGRYILSPGFTPNAS